MVLNYEVENPRQEVLLSKLHPDIKCCKVTAEFYVGESIFHMAVAFTSPFLYNSQVHYVMRVSKTYLPHWQIGSENSSCNI